MQKTVMLGLAAAALAVIVLGSIFIGGSHSEKPVQPPSAETLRLSDTVTKAYMDKRGTVFAGKYADAGGSRCDSGAADQL